MCASPAANTAWVVTGVLVEGNLEATVVVAKNVTALTAVMPARPRREVLLACRVVTYSRLVVGLL